MTRRGLPQLAALCLALAGSAGARELYAPAAAPTAALAADGSAPPRATANMVFTLSADKATFTADTLVLSGVALSVPFKGSGSRVKVLSTGAFTNSTLGSPLVSSDGMWLDVPQAILYGAAPGGNLSSIALTLQSVAPDTDARIVRFNVSTLQPAAGATKLQGGPVAAATQDSQQGSGPRLLTAPPTGQTWSGAVLVIESSSTALRQPAETKTFWLGWGGPGWGGGWGNGGWGNGWGGGGWGPGWWGR